MSGKVESLNLSQNKGSITLPRPILKKSPTIHTKKNPLFFSGNESTCHEEDKDELNLSQNRYKTQHSILIDELNDLAAEASSCTNEEDRFKRSSLKSNSNPTLLNKKRKKPVSSVYIFHSKEIDNEILKILISSTDGFLEDFKRSIYVSEDYEDSQLLKVFKEKFVPKLKEFLLSNESITSHQLRTSNLGITLSEPLFSDIESCRKNSHRNRLTSSHSEQFSLKFSTENLDAVRNNENIDKLMCGSLPATSILDHYTNELKLRESVLLKSIRSKSVKTNQDSLVIAHAHAAFNNGAKEKNKSIVSAATTSKKIVRFADAFGLDLEKVKIITNNSFMDAFSHEYRDEEDEKVGKDSKGSGAVSNPFLVLIPLFGLRKQDMVIKLEDYIYDYENKIIKCIVKVRNLSFEKRVFARISFNNWKSFYDLDAIFIRTDKGPKDKATSHVYDFFGFCIIIPEKSSEPMIFDPEAKQVEERTLRIEFALCCVQNAVTFWDSNFGENYKFQCFYNKPN